MRIGRWPYSGGYRRPRVRNHSGHVRFGARGRPARFENLSRRHAPLAWDVLEDANTARAVLGGSLLWIAPRVYSQWVRSIYKDGWWSASYGIGSMALGGGGLRGPAVRTSDAQRARRAMVSDDSSFPRRRPHISESERELPEADTSIGKLLTLAAECVVGQLRASWHVGEADVGTTVPIGRGAAAAASPQCQPSRKSRHVEPTVTCEPPGRPVSAVVGASHHISQLWR